MNRLTIPMQTVSEQAAAQARSGAEAAREQAANARDFSQVQRSAADEIRQAAREAAQIGATGPNGAVTITLPNGKIITLDGASPEAIAAALGLPPREPRQESDGPYVVAGLGIVSTALVVLAAVTMWYRTKTRGGGARSAQLPAELTQRMARMETAIESVAIEVERISEGQRFTTRLLSDRAPLEVPRG